MQPLAGSPWLANPSHRLYKGKLIPPGFVRSAHKRNLRPLGTKTVFPVVTQHVNRVTNQRYFRIDNCYQAAPLAVAVLRTLGFDAQPLSMESHVLSSAALRSYKETGQLDPDTNFYSMGAGPEANRLTQTGWKGHLVAESEGWVLDPTIGQAKEGFADPTTPQAKEFIDYAPSYLTFEWCGQSTDRSVLVIPRDTDMGVLYRPRPENDNWQHVPQTWKPLLHEVVRRVIADPRLARSAGIEQTPGSAPGHSETMGLL